VDLVEDTDQQNLYKGFWGKKNSLLKRKQKSGQTTVKPQKDKRNDDPLSFKTYPTLLYFITQ